VTGKPAEVICLLNTFCIIGIADAIYRVIEQSALQIERGYECVVFHVFRFLYIEDAAFLENRTKC